MAYHFRNLIFEGGGVKGIACVGATQVLEEKGILQNIVRVGGASAGAINALLLGLNYSPADTEKIFLKMDFKNFLDDSWGVVRDAQRVVKEFGWYKGDFFRNWIAKLIEEKTGNPNSTFKDIHDQKERHGFRDTYFICTNLSTGFAEVFSFEHTPRTCIADAVRMSMSIPLFFAAKRSIRGDVYVDGGLLDNYPIKLFDRKKYVEAYCSTPKYYKEHNDALERESKKVSFYVYNKETLGFRLDSAKEIAIFRDQAEPERCKIEDFFSYAWNLVSTFLGIQESRHLHSDDWQRTIYIDTLDVGTTEFDLSTSKKKDLVKSGKVNAEKYFQWYDDLGEHPANRP